MKRTSYRYLGWQCNLGCRYVVLDDEDAVEAHLHEVHGVHRDPLPAPRRPGALRSRVVTAVLAVVCGALLLLVACHIRR